MKFLQMFQLAVILCISLLPVYADAISIDRNLTVGSQGSDVQALQEFLIRQKYLATGASGYYGELTKTAVIKFQTVNNLEPVGSVGPKTRAMLIRLDGGNNTNFPVLTESSEQTAAVLVKPAPTVSLISGASSVQSGSSVTLAWTSGNATNCTAGGDWSGVQATSGTRIITSITASKTFSLTCVGAGGTTTKQTAVTVSSTSTQSVATSTSILYSGDFTGEQYQPVLITFNWNAVPMSKNYGVFVHFIDSTGKQISTQLDHSIPNVSTMSWKGPVTYTRTLNIPSNLPTGKYTIMVGMFENTAGYPKIKLTAGPGVTQTNVSDFRYKTGTLQVQAGTNLPQKPVVPADIGGSKMVSKANAGDPIPSTTFTDDYHPANMKLVFHDEFDDAAVDTNTWAGTYNWGNRFLGGNQEKQCYLERNTSQVGGKLILEAKKEAVVCPKPNQVQEYTSGMINSSQSYTQKYGYFVMKAKLPKGKGYWPAFWLLPASDKWPPEIDIMEVLSHKPSEIYTTYHYNNASGTHKTFAKMTVGPNTSDGYHLYAVDWQPGKIVWYVDGVEYYRIQDPSVHNGPMYILANLAVGGSWPGNPDATTVFPATMDIDYIRAYATGTSTTPTAPVIPAPTLTLSVDKTSVDFGNPVQLTWNASNTTSCVATGNWSGTKANAGNELTGPLTASQTFTLACTGAGGSVSKSVAVTVIAPTLPPVATTSTAIMNARGVNLPSTKAGPYIAVNASNTSITGDNKNNSLQNTYRSGATLTGKAGDDFYFTNWPADRIIELQNEGVDSIGYFGESLPYTLPSNIENLYTNGVVATGNELNNYIQGGSRKPNTLNGGLGDDLLIGGATKNTFVIQKGNGSDAIRLFKKSTDVIQLSGYADIKDFSSLSYRMIQNGNDTIIILSGTEILVIRDSKPTDFSSANFVF